MPFGAVTLTPGINVEPTPTLLRTGYFASQLIRFRGGLAQKLGGWMKYYPFAVTGRPWELHSWQDLNATGHLSVGTTVQWGVITGGSTYQDITPQTKTTDFSPNFTTTAGSPVVTVTDSNISTVTTFDSIFFNTPIAIDGIVLSGVYPITLNLSTHAYEITAATNAIAGVTGGGAVPSFTTVSGSSTVTVTIAAHGLTVGDTSANQITFPIATTVGGVTIKGTYSVIGVTSASAFTIAASSQASSSTTSSMNSGNCELVYYLAIGPLAASTGWGIGGYGSGGWGTGSTAGQQTGTDIAASDWSMDNWGALAIGCPSGGGAYYWDPNGGFQNASLIAQAPIFNGGAFVAMPAQILVVWGATQANGIGVSQNPLLVSWSDQLNFFQWTPSATTQAGSYLVPTGSRIVGAIQAPQIGMIWTDIDLYSMSYMGGTGLVFAFSKIAGNCGLIARHARCVLNGVVYWFSQANVFRYDGTSVSPVPCSVWDVMFQNLDPNNVSKAWCWANTLANEVWFFFASASGGTGDIDSYIKYNILENAWDYGSLSRTCGIDLSSLGFPLAATPNGLIYAHENGNDADGSALSYSFTSGWFFLAEGEDYVTVDRLFPDFKWGTFNGPQTAQISLQLNMVNYSGDTPRVFGPWIVTQSTKFVPLRARGRQAQFVVSGNDVGSFTRMGGLRYRYQPDGRR